MTYHAHVLYVSYDGLTDPLGQSQVLPYLLSLTQHGYRFSIISAEKPAAYKTGKKDIEKIIKGYPIEWYPIFYTKYPPVLSTIFDIRKIIKKAKKIYKEDTYKLVHCRSYIAAYAGLYAQKKYNTKFVFDMRGFFADERVDGKIWQLKNPLYKFIYQYFKKQEIKYFSKADYTVSLTHAGKNIIQSWDTLNQPVPIKVIPCCADLELFSIKNTQNIAHWKQKLAITDNAFVLSYLGSIGTWYMLNEMLAFFKQLQLTYKDAIFLFITKDNPEAILKEAAMLNISREAIRIQSAKRTEVPSLLALCSMSIFFIKPVFSKKASSPTKMGEIMGMGIPLICNSGVGDVDYVMQNYKAGIMIDNFNNTDYQKAIDNIEKALDYPKSEIRNAAKEFYALSSGVNSYKKIYEKCLG